MTTAKPSLFSRIAGKVAHGAGSLAGQISTAVVAGTITGTAKGVLEVGRASVKAGVAKAHELQEAKPIDPVKVERQLHALEPRILSVRLGVKALEAKLDEAKAACRADRDNVELLEKATTIKVSLHKEQALLARLTTKQAYLTGKLDGLKKEILDEDN